MMDYYSRGLRDSKPNDAPEVHYTNYPVALPPDEEGLQAVEEVDAKEYRRDDVAITKDNRTRRRKTWIWIAIAVVLCLVGFGAGIGVGIAVEQGSTESTPTTDPSGTSTTTVPSNTAQAEPVTSGTTGIAAFSCNSTVKSAQYLNEGVTFTEECYCDYANGGAAWNSTTNSASKTQIINNIVQYTVYSFEECMNQCVDWNNERSRSMTKCMAVSYSANLTDTVSSLAGNCFLKPLRGVPLSPANADLWASAYIIDD